MKTYCGNTVAKVKCHVDTVGSHKVKADYSVVREERCIHGAGQPFVEGDEGGCAGVGGMEEVVEGEGSIPLPHFSRYCQVSCSLLPLTSLTW